MWDTYCWVGWAFGAWTESMYIYITVRWAIPRTVVACRGRFCHKDRDLMEQRIVYLTLLRKSIISIARYRTYLVNSHLVLLLPSLDYVPLINHSQSTIHHPLNTPPQLPPAHHLFPAIYIQPYISPTSISAHPSSSPRSILLQRAFHPIHPTSSHPVYIFPHQRHHQHSRAA